MRSEEASALKLWANVWEELVFSVMGAGCFCEKSGWIGKVEDVKPALKKKTDFNRQPFEEEDSHLDELWNRRISSGLIHLGPDIS
jgi:hypothetical protein